LKLFSFLSVFDWKGGEGEKRGKTIHMDLLSQKINHVRKRKGKGERGGALLLLFLQAARKRGGGKKGPGHPFRKHEGILSLPRAERKRRKKPLYILYQRPVFAFG